MKYPPPTKCEVLITRGCNLSCLYCAMKKYYAKFDSTAWKDAGEMTDKEWSKVPEILQELGVEFAPIYGAEPLTRYTALKNFIKNAHKIGLATTVITNGVYLTDRIINGLKKCGLDSITLSHDISEFPDDNSMVKSNIAYHLLDKCKKNFRDVEVVVTVTKKNFKLLPQFIKQMSEKEIWTHFDIYHPDRGQAGSKCYGFVTNLMFDYKDKEEFVDVIKQVKDLKRDGCFIHVTEEVLDMMIREYERYVVCYGWKCKGPGWITLDASGFLYGCDDFQPPLFKYHILQYDKNWNWDEFVEAWSKQLIFCPGCFWITHVMSDLWWGKKGWEKYIKHLI